MNICQLLNDLWADLESARLRLETANAACGNLLLESTLRETPRARSDEMLELIERAAHECGGAHRSYVQRLMNFNETLTNARRAGVVWPTPDPVHERGGCGSGPH